MMRVVSAGAVAMLMASAVYQAVLFEDLAPAVRDSDGNSLIFLPSPVQARVMALGFTTAVADYYWVKALQYFTNPANETNQYRNLADILEVVVGVDPQYRYAYKFAGLAIPYDTGRFRYKHTRRATSFLERGVARFPEWWELHFLLGYNYLNFHKEPVKAAEQFRLAAQIPDAPAYLAPFSARVLAIGGDIERAIAVSEEFLQHSDDPEVRATMQKRVADLHAEKELRRIEAAAAAFRVRNGRFPAGLFELVGQGFSPPPPEGYTLDANGVAKAPGTERMILHSISQQAGFGAID